MTENDDKSVQLQLNLDDPTTNDKLMKENIQLHKQIAFLQSENKRLYQMLNIENVSTTQREEISDEYHSTFLINNLKLITKQSSLDEKIACFRDYFKGREDVYALRGIDRTGKSAYFTQRQRLGKKDGKYIWGENIPLKNEIFELHLQEKTKPVTIGLYPLLLDETCWFLAIDFDKKGWKEDTASFLKTCHEFQVPASLERSRSGNGGHVWIFFNEPIAAKTARMLGSTLLTVTLEKRYQVGLDSYDRLFPNQDTLPRDKKLGNLIALPFQRIPGEAGNSLFIDENLQHYKDQWTYLSSIRKMSLSEVEAIVQKAEQKGDIIHILKPITEENEEIKPWKLTSNKNKPSSTELLPKHMKLVLSNMLYLEKQELTSAQINDFIQTAAFQNPEFYKAQAMRLSTKGIPRIINCSEDFPNYLALPRGCYEQVNQILASNGVEIELIDESIVGLPIDVTFNGELKEQQIQAVNELIKHDMGVLSATTAFGKTVIGTWMIANRSVNTLILVHRAQLMDQWKEKIALFLNIPVKEIGLIGGGKNKRTGRIDIAMLQSVHSQGEVKDYIADYGQIIIDECHHISAFSFEQVLKKAKAKYILGLTATLIRKDGHHPIVLMQCGPV
ncbi:MAG: restriction endonuclease subunit, partial [Bacilli bacterium]|nr:restriction endonuclease subunit [Bacilli bacterium]